MYEGYNALANVRLKRSNSNSRMIYRGQRTKEITVKSCCTSPLALGRTVLVLFSASGAATDVPAAIPSQTHTATVGLCPPASQQHSLPYGALGEWVSRDVMEKGRQGI